MVATESDLTGVLLEARYRVEQLLAVGGMSRVYRGTDLRLDREVAIKVMDSRLAADPAFRGRFEREARAIARLDHPGIVDVYDQGEHGGPPDPVVFLVMELVTGGTLRDVLRERGALSVPEALAVLEAVLGALAAAHAQGMTHRDVKPENVLISQSGAVKVADFGLVTAAARANPSTAGMIVGTVAYLSPEQVTGHAVDAHSDVYSAGIVLFEMLTGRPPFDGEHAMAVAYQHVNRDVPAPSSVRPGLPPNIDALVISATRRDPHARPPDATTLLHALRGVRAALGIRAAPIPVPGRASAVVPPLVTSARGDAAAAHPGDGPGSREPKRTRALTSFPAGTATDYLARRRRGRRLATIWLTLFALLAALIGLVGWNVGAGQWSAMPSVVGLDQVSAEHQVGDAGLVVSLRQTPDDRVPAGTVAAATPAGGTRLRKGATVTLTVSTGRPRVPAIPAGTSVPDAERMVRDAGLTPREDSSSYSPHPTAPPGTVIGTSPGAGTVLAVSNSVTLVLSSGPRQPRRPRGDDIGSSIADLLRRQLDRALSGGG